MKNKIIVFYDGMCGMCSKEINYYKSIAPQNTFTWIDITKQPLSFTELGYKLSAGLQILHVQDANKVMHKGVTAFITIWRQLKYWKILSYLIAVPIIKQLVQLTYIAFAKWRFRKMNYGQCKL